MRHTIIVASKLGQLGNRLILFAHLIALAREHGFRVVNPAFADYAVDFEGPSSGLLCPYPPRRGSFSKAACEAGILALRLVRKFRLENHLGSVIANPGMEPADDFNLDSPEYLRIIKASRRCVLWGWRYRNYELVSRHAESIREYFRPVAVRRTAAQALVEDMRQSSDCVVGVHIRQGDYRGFQGGQHFFSTDDYAARMRQVAEELASAGARPSFLVCSNVRQNPADFGGLPVRFGTGQIVEDLHALSLCSRILAVPSTYSYWASFMGKVPLRYLSRDAAVVGGWGSFPEGC